VATKIAIITYNRPNELNRLVNELQGLDYIVIDDGSDYDPFLTDRLVRIPHQGKKGFWLTYRVVISQLLKSDADDYVILADDVHSIDFHTVAEIQSRYRDEYYTVNMINDSRKHCWAAAKKHKVDEDMINKGFFDCGGLTNRKTLELIKLNPMPDTWWTPNKSSGVGYQITKQLRHKAKMLTPKKSLAKHGDSISQMHPIERTINPLVSI
jgi:hypothetical protein